MTAGVVNLESGDVSFSFAPGTVKKTPMPILLDLSPVSFLDIIDRVSVSYMPWMVTKELVPHVEELTAWIDFPQVRNVLSKLSLILHTPQVLWVPPWPPSSLSFLLSFTMMSMLDQAIENVESMWKIE